MAEPVETKFNPNHDPKDGRFTFADGANMMRTMGLPVDGGPKRRTQPQAPRKPNGQKPTARKPQSPARAYTADELVKQFKQHMIPSEDDRNDVYLDSQGILTAGIGHKVLPSDGFEIG